MHLANIYNWHKNHWKHKGETESEEYLNEMIEEFETLLDEKLNPAVHTVRYTYPLDYDVKNRFETNVLISDV